MRRLQRTNPGIDYIKFLADFAKKRHLAEYSADAIRQFGEDVVSTVGESVSASHRLRGVRAEAVFMAVVAALGKVKLIKEEDSGEAFYLGDDLALPDFRVVLDGGRQLLVEVKVQPLAGSPYTSLKLSDSYVQRLRRYCEIAGGELLFAVFWEERHCWTLNTLSAFSPGNHGEGKWSLPFMRAYTTTEMMLLGDYTVGTRAPLRLRVRLDPERSEPVPEEGGAIKVMIDGLELLSQGTVLDGLSARIAWKLIWYGSWSEWPTESRVENGKLLYIDHPIGPSVRDDEAIHPEEMHFIGTLSEMISRAYLEGAKGTIHTQSESELLAPGWTGEQFIPDDWLELDLTLPIAKFYVRPNYELWPPDRASEGEA